DTSRQTKNLNKLLIRILLHLQVEFSQDTFHPLLFPLHERQRHTRIQLPAQAHRQCKRRMGEGQKGMKLIL
ncbi:hypothetical protein, partial [Bacteroides uniformis]|uniref:hypothetical protein n=1 Tax=Bacteroides uniformis TaxID=820 RepID=UPI001956BD0F